MHDSQIEASVKKFLESKYAKSSLSTKTKLLDLLKQSDFNLNHIKRYSLLHKGKGILGMSGEMISIDANVELEQTPATKSIGLVKSNDQINGTTTTGKVLKSIYFRNENGNIYDGKLVLILSSVNSTEFIEKNLDKILLNKEPEFSGTVIINSLQGKFSNSILFENGKLLKFSKLSFNASATSSVRNLTACVAWYLETTYYYSDGTVITTTEFLGTTGCGGSGDINNEGLEPPGEGSQMPPDSICAQNQTYAADPYFQASVQVLKDSSSSNFERGFYITKNGTANVFTQIPGNNPAGVAAPSFPTGGIFHNHIATLTNMAKTFSLIDLKAFYWLYQNGLMTDLSSFVLGLVLPTWARIA